MSKVMKCHLDCAVSQTHSHQIPPFGGILLGLQAMCSLDAGLGLKGCRPMGVSPSPLGSEGSTDLVSHHPSPPCRRPGAPVVENPGFCRFGGFDMEDAGLEASPAPSSSLWGRAH